MTKCAASVIGKDPNQERRRKSTAHQVAVCMGTVCMDIYSMEMGIVPLLERQRDLIYFALLD